MRFTHLRLSNWRNFLDVDVSLEQRVFLVGPNAAGKSNLLDVLRFLRDVAEPAGGFLRAIQQRGGVSQIRSLHARLYSNVSIEVSIDLDGIAWTYLLEFNQDKLRRPVIRREVVRREDEVILQRPDSADEDDPTRLSQTHLEQVNANQKFRDVTAFLSQVRYLHLVPQLVREPDRSIGRAKDPYGGDFLEQVARTTEKTRASRLKRIENALQIAVPQLKKLELFRDELGVPHLRGLYEHWRPNAGWQTEKQFSDGTLRLLGLLWVLLDGRAPLLLEEPELSLHATVVRYLPAMMARLNRKSMRQTVVSTHSAELLGSDEIALEEVLLLEPSIEGTRVTTAVDVDDVRELVTGGMPVGEVVLPRTAPRNASQLLLFGE